MRLLHLTDRLSSRGGADWHLLGVLDALAAEHDVLLAVGSDDGSAEAPCEIALVPALASRVAQAGDLDGLVERFEPDLLHLHNIVNPKVLNWAAAHRALMTVQDHRAFCPGRGKWTVHGDVCREQLSPTVCAGCFDDPGYFADILVLTAARLQAMHSLELTVLSEYMRAELVAAGCAAQRVHVIPPFVHDLPAGAAEGEPCVLFVGRLVAAKGIFDALEAWKRSAVELPLVFAGTGSARAELEAAGATVTGWLGHTELAALYRRAAAVVMPSRWQEPFGIVGLEALQSGVPVVAWDSGGVCEWHPGGDLLVPWGDVDGLAAALRLAIGRSAQPATGFEPDAMMRRLTELYRRLVAEPTAGT